MTRRGFGALALAALAGACAPRPARRDAPRGVGPAPPAEDVLVVGRAADPVGLDPATLSDLESIQATEPIFDTLVRFREGSLEVEPSLATSWRSSPDGREWLLELREGVRFHDGTACDAGAVAWNLERQLDPGSQYRYGQVFAYWPLVWGTPSTVVAVEPLGRQKVRFRLSEPVAPFLDNLAMSYFAIASPEALERARQDASRHPVGTGPFRLAEWRPGERLILERFEGCWSGPPGMHRLEFLPVADDTSRMLQVQASRVHLATQVRLEDVESLRRDPAVRVTTETGMNVGFLAMNNRRPPFDDVRVRQAVAHAVDVPAIVEGLFRELARPAGSPLPPPVWGRVDPGPVRYDPEAARRLLAEAGLARGFDCQLAFMPVSRPYMPEPRAVGEALQAMLAEVGVRTELTTSDWSQYLDDTARGDYDLALMGWVGDHGDPENYLFTLFSSQNIDTEVGGSNLFLYSNPEVDRRLERARSLLRRSERETLYRQSQELLRRDMPWVPLAYADLVAVHHPALEGFRLHPSGALRLHSARWRR